MLNKILGGLIGGAAGDAMGAATEARSAEAIAEYFGGRVTTFEVPPMDTFGRGNKAGGVTDDFSSAYYMAESIINSGGIVTAEAVKVGLIEWSKHEEFFDRFVGPTTKRAIEIFKGRTFEMPSSVNLAARQATNGAAMRIAPIGLIDARDIEKAVNDAVIVTKVTHNNQLAISGACAVAAAVSRASCENADLIDVIKAGLYGAEKGEEAGIKSGEIVAGPSVIRRMEMAVDIGLGHGSIDKKLKDISDYIGTGLHISEAVPSAFGILAANNGNCMESIISAVNIGYDTDTIATITGAIAGTLQGAEVFPCTYLPLLEKVNNLRIEKLAVDIENLNKFK